MYSFYIVTGRGASLHNVFLAIKTYWVHSIVVLPPAHAGTCPTTCPSIQSWADIAIAGHRCSVLGNVTVIAGTGLLLMFL